MPQVNPVPPGPNLIPSLVVKGGKQAIEFYKRAFGAQDHGAMYMPDGSLMHGEMTIGNGRFMLGEESPEWGALSPQKLGGSPVSIHIYTDDCDALFQRATAAGAKPKMPPADMFWGDRYARVVDPFGHEWGILTHKEDVSPAEMDQRAKDWMASMAKK